MFSLPHEEEGLAFLFLPPPIIFPIWNTSEVQFEFRAPSRLGILVRTDIEKYFGEVSTNACFSPLLYIDLSWYIFPDKR